MITTVLCTKGDRSVWSWCEGDRSMWGWCEARVVRARRLRVETALRRRDRKLAKKVSANEGA